MLPEFRIESAHPFSYTGVDYFGPLYTCSVDGGLAKVWVLLVTCATSNSRAVHLELVSNMTSEQFLIAFKRFTSRKGMTGCIRSDNAKTFKATAGLLGKLFETTEVRDYLREKQIKWEFNLEKAPLWGGFSERLVKTTKNALTKTLGNAKLKFEELSTVLIEIEGVVNNRPLTYVDEDLLEPLTPAHLLYGRRIEPVNNLETSSLSTEETIRKRYFFIRKVLKDTQTRWARE